MIASLGFFLFPLIELRPNRLASGIPFALLQLSGDLRYFLLFVLALLPLGLAFWRPERQRGWWLMAVGGALLVLTLYLSASAGTMLLSSESERLGEGVRVSNPRMSPATGLLLGLLGGYLTQAAGLSDLRRNRVKVYKRSLAAWLAPLIILGLFLTKRLDVYSVVVEFYSRGEQLSQAVIEHLMFVIVALVVGLVLGIGLGLWAHRDKRISPVVLYTVGIIQTIPSLALYGILLVPLARLGNLTFSRVLLFLLAFALLAALLIWLYRSYAAGLAQRLRYGLMLLTALVCTVPLALIVVILSSFLFRSSLYLFTRSDAPFPTLRLLLLGTLVLALLFWALSRLTAEAAGRALHLLSQLAFLGFGLVLLYALLRASAALLSDTPNFSALTIRDLGVSGIGTAPAVIALTLYSLLPLVRNTYAGLRNVDAAVVDSGRGMGMNASQRFMQLELPIALPVILAGVRNAAVSLVGIGAVAAVIGAGGLGEFILGGIINTSVDQILLGLLPAVFLALSLDVLVRGLERLLVSPGIRTLAD